MDTLKPRAGRKMRETSNPNVFFAQCIRLRNGLRSFFERLIVHVLSLSIFLTMRTQTCIRVPTIFCTYSEYSALAGSSHYIL